MLFVKEVEYIFTSVHHLTKHTCVLEYSALAEAHSHTLFFSCCLSAQPFEIVFHIKSAMQECVRVHASIKTHAFCAVFVAFLVGFFCCVSVCP